MITQGASHPSPSDSSKYESMIGDHPCVSDHGPPLGLGWGYYDDGVLAPVDTFEMTHGPYPFKHKKITPLASETRRIILTHFFDVSPSEIRKAQAAVARTKKQRLQSLENRSTRLERIRYAMAQPLRRRRSRRTRVVPLDTKQFTKVATPQNLLM